MGGLVVRINSSALWVQVDWRALPQICAQLASRETLLPSGPEDERKASALARNQHHILIAQRCLKALADRVLARDQVLLFGVQRRGIAELRAERRLAHRAGLRAHRILRAVHAVEDAIPFM